MNSAVKRCSLHPAIVAIWSICAVIVWGLALYLVYASSRNTPVNADGGYFLGTARAIVSGMQPYSPSLELWYPPVSLYLYSIPIWFGVNAQDPTLIFVFQHTFTLLSGVLLARIAAQFCAISPLPWVVGGSYVILSILFEGQYIVLEPFTVFFILVSLWGALRADYGSALLSGVSLGVAVLCKQYAVFAVAPVMVALFCNRRTMWYRGALLLTSAAFTFAVVVALLFFNGSTVAGLYQGFAPVQYLGIKYPRSGVVHHFVEKFPILFFTPLLLLFNDSRRSPYLWLSVLGLVGGASFLLVRQWQHYFILFLPFALLLAALLVERLQGWKGGLAVIGLAGFIPLIMSAIPFVEELQTSRSRQRQNELCRSFSEVTELARPTIAFANPALMWVCGFLHAKNGKGFNFPESYPSDELLRILPEQGLVITEVDDAGSLAAQHQRLFEESPNQIFDILVSAGFQKIDRVPGYVMWINPRLKE